MDNSHMIRVIEIRLKEMGITKKQFYRDTGISSATFSQWNTGMFAPSGKSLKIVSEYINVSISELTGETKKESPPHSGEPVGPNKRALLDLVETMSDEEMGALLEIVRATLKMRETRGKYE